MVTHIFFFKDRLRTLESFHFSPLYSVSLNVFSRTLDLATYSLLYFLQARHISFSFVLLGFPSSRIPVLLSLLITHARFVRKFSLQKFVTPQ